MQLSEITDRVIAQANPSVPGKPSESLQTTSAMAMTLLDDQEGRKLLTNLLSQCYDALKVYGKEPEQLDNLNKMFHLVLADYPIEKITKAFAFYLRHYTELPAPADIARIIDRGGDKPPFERSVYNRISKKYIEDLTPEEGRYLKEYERFIITGKN